MGRLWGWRDQEGPEENPAPRPKQSAISDGYLSVTTPIKNTNSVKSDQAEMSLLLITKLDMLDSCVK